MADKQFPEQPHTKHKPNDEKVSYHKSSTSVGHGHQDFDSRMPHPAHQDIPNEESGEGCGGM